MFRSLCPGITYTRFAHQVLSPLTDPDKMPFKSSFPDLEIPQTDLLSYLFGNRTLSDEPLWFNSSQPTKNLSPKQALQWIKRLGLGLSQLDMKKGDVVLMFTPNHIFVPVAYLGIVGSGCVFSGANPSYTVQGSSADLTSNNSRSLKRQNSYAKYRDGL